MQLILLAINILFTMFFIVCTYSLHLQGQKQTIEMLKIQKAIYSKIAEESTKTSYIIDVMETKITIISVILFVLASIIAYGFLQNHAELASHAYENKKLQVGMHSQQNDYLQGLISKVDTKVDANNLQSRQILDSIKEAIRTIAEVPPENLENVATVVQNLT